MRQVNRDRRAQIVIASFEDAYHVRTLQQLLQTCLLLQPGVEVHRIMSLLMDRLTDYAAESDDDIFQDDAAFQCFLSAARGCGIKCASPGANHATCATVQSRVCLLRRSARPSACAQPAYRHASMPAAGVVQMFLALTKFVASVYHNDDAMLNQTMEGCHEALRERGHVTSDAETLLLTLLQLPLDVRCQPLPVVQVMPHTRK